MNEPRGGLGECRQAPAEWQAVHEVLRKTSAGLAVELTRDFIRIPTTNPPGSEAALARMIVERGAELGLAGELQFVVDDRPNAVLTLPGDAGARQLLYCGHLDTVQVGETRWSWDPFCADILEGRIAGRGASDMKGGLAAMIAGMAALRAARIRPPGDVVLAAVVGEEVDCLGSRAFLDAGGMDDVGALVIGEPTNLDVVIAHKGAVRIQVTVHGRASHSAMPHLGVNAITYMLDFIRRLPEVQLGGGSHPLLGAPTVSVNMIQGGVRPNIVADRCSANVEIRTLPGQRTADIVAALESAADEVRAADPALVVEIVTDQEVAGVETPADDRLVRVALEAAERVTGHPATTRGIPIFSDGSVLQPPTGVPTILFGPGDERTAHQVDEYVEISNVVTAAEVFATLPLLLGEDPGS